MRDYLLIAAAIFVVGAVTSLAALQPRSGEQVAVLFPPWIDQQSVAHRVWSAGGRVLSATGSTVIAVGEADGFFTLLRDNGAIAIFDAAKIQALCGAPTKS